MNALLVHVKLCGISDFLSIAESDGSFGWQVDVDVDVEGVEGLEGLDGQ